MSDSEPGWGGSSGGSKVRRKSEPLLWCRNLVCGCGWVNGSGFWYESGEVETR